jgi:hypothetical protein
MYVPERGFTMKSKIVAVLALSTAIVVPAAFAQQSGSQSASTQPAAMSSQGAKIEVIGTVVTLTTDRIDVRVNKVKAPEGTSAPSSITAGEKTAFTLDSSSQMPQGLKVGDNVDVWFTNHNGSLLATKVALAAGADQSSGTYGSAATSQPANQSADNSQSSSAAASDSSDQADMSDSSTSASQSASATQPANATSAATTANRTKLPKTASPLPLIGLIGLAALASAFALRFALRA